MLAGDKVEVELVVNQLPAVDKVEVERVKLTSCLLVTRLRWNWLS